jgi:hypothetical protein
MSEGPLIDAAGRRRSAVNAARIPVRSRAAQQGHEVSG